MDRASSVLAAFQAGKFPTQKQISAFVDNLLASNLITVDSVAGNPELTAQGKKVAGDFRELLSAYKDIGEKFNGTRPIRHTLPIIFTHPSSRAEDDTLQEVFWHLSQADLANTSLGGPNNTGDARKLGASLRTALGILWANTASEGTSLFHDFASFSRLTLADAAELVETNAAAAKDALRQTESEVQAGERNAGTGTKKRPAEDEPEDADARVKFEKTMDQVKVAGSKGEFTISYSCATLFSRASQSSARARKPRRPWRTRRTRPAQGCPTHTTRYIRVFITQVISPRSPFVSQVCERAQKDPEYQDAISTVLDLVQKWLDKTLDTAADVNQGTSLDTFIDDPTPEQHVPKALRGARVLAERLSGGKSLDDLFACVRSCAADIRSDPDTKAWFDDFFAHARKSLREPGYVRSDEATQAGERLRTRWQELLDADSDVGRKWKTDVEALQREAREFQARAADEPALTRLREAQAKFADDLTSVLSTAGSLGLQTLSESAWIWKDMFNVYLTRVLGMMKGLPIPRCVFMCVIVMM